MDIERGSSRITFYAVEVPLNIGQVGDYQMIISRYNVGIERGSSRSTFYPVEVPFSLRLVGDYIKVKCGVWKGDPVEELSTR